MTDAPPPATNDTGDSKQQLQEIVASAFAEAPLLYANGFVNGLNVADSYLVLQTNGRSVAVVSLPLSVAKSLGQSLLDMVTAFEKQTNETVPTLDQLRGRML
ncbi:MAG TPA: hypothetical protein VGL99_26680 [Chloroflexota bacterium]|jgi:hypothetical protein